MAGTTPKSYWAVSCRGEAQADPPEKSFSFSLERERWHISAAASKRLWWFIIGAIASSHPLTLKLLTEFQKYLGAPK